MSTQLFKYQYKTIFFICIGSLILSIVPLPPALETIRPSWVLVMLVCVAMEFPLMLSIIFVWFLGLFMDLLVSDLFGLHAFLFVSIFFVVRRLNRLLFGVPLWQRTTMVSMIFLFGFLVQYALNWCVGRPSSFGASLWLVPVNVVVWRLLYPIFGGISQRSHRLYARDLVQ